MADTSPFEVLRQIGIALQLGCYPVSSERPAHLKPKCRDPPERGLSTKDEVLDRHARMDVLLPCRVRPRLWEKVEMPVLGVEAITLASLHVLHRAIESSA